MRIIIDFVTRDFSNNPFIFTGEMVATMLSVAAALYLALSTAGANFLLVYTLFLLSTLLFIVTSWKRGIAWVLFLNLVFTGINVTGLINSL